MFGAIAGGIASALAGGAMSKLFGGGQKAASGGIQGDVLATDNNTVGMGDAGIKSAIQGSNVPNPDEAVPSFVSGAMAKAGKGLLEGTLQAGTSAVSDKLLDLVGLGGKSAADKGKDTRDYLAAAFPELNAWERAGADASSAGMVDAGFENQKELTKMQLDNQKDRKSGSAGMPRPISYAVFCLKKKNDGDILYTFDSAKFEKGIDAGSGTPLSYILLFLLSGHPVPSISSSSLPVFSLSILPLPPRSTLFPYTTLFRSMLGSVLVLMLPLLVWLTPDLRIKKSLLKCNWTIRKRLPRCKMRLKKRLLAFSRRLHARIRKTRYMHKMRCLLINRRSLLLALRLLWKTPIFPSNSRFPRLCAKCLLKLKRLVSILPMTKSKK